VVSLPDLAGVLAGVTGTLAVMFGPEKTGLTGAYLERCHAWLTVPTDGRTPSMNLSHAVAVCCYELARALGTARPPLDTQPALLEMATVEQRNRLVRHARDVVDAAGYLDFLPAAEKTRKLRRTFLGWGIRRRDVALMHGFFRFLVRAMKSAPMKGAS
jgi:tRNA C32,U32 (ribose-2'-O)-methylase TrmJ